MVSASVIMVGVLMVGFQEDQARHRASLLAWLHRNGYHSMASLRSASGDVKRMVAEAGVEDLLMPDPTPRSGHKSVSLEWLPQGQGPPQTSRKSVYDDLVDQLRQHPGQWAALGEQGTGCIHTLRKRGLQVSQRHNGSAKPQVYVRFEPPQDATSRTRS